MKHYTLAKVKEKELHHLMNWCDYLMKNKKRAKQSMNDSNVQEESAYLFKLGKNYYVLGMEKYDGRAKRKKSYSTLSVAHRAVLQSCLFERDSNPVKLYEVK